MFSFGLLILCGAAVIFLSVYIFLLLFFISKNVDLLQLLQKNVWWSQNFYAKTLYYVFSLCLSCKY